MSPRAVQVVVALAVVLVLAGALAALLVGHWPLVVLGVSVTVAAWFALTFRSAARGARGPR